VVKSKKTGFPEVERHFSRPLLVGLPVVRFGGRRPEFPPLDQQSVNMV
jgi:hypothetical protein